MKVWRGRGVFEKVFFVVGRLAGQRVRTLLVPLRVRQLKIGVFAGLELWGKLVLGVFVAVKIGKGGRSISLHRVILLFKRAKKLTVNENRVCAFNFDLRPSP